MTTQQAGAAEVPDLVDRVAEAMTGWPMSTANADTADAWRNTARSAISAVEDWLLARAADERENADRTRRTLPGEAGRSYAANQLRKANGLAGAAGQLRRQRTKPPEVST